MGKRVAETSASRRLRRKKAKARRQEVEEREREEESEEEEEEAEACPEWLRLWLQSKGLDRFQHREGECPRSREERLRAWLRAALNAAREQ